MPFKPKILKCLSLAVFFIALPLWPAKTPVQGASLGERLAGRFLIQVEAKGECYYVDPITRHRIYLGRPDDAFRLMRQYSLGISEADYTRFIGQTPRRLAGRFILRAQAKGQAYYVEPVSRRLVYLGRPDDAFQIMRQYGLGITNLDLFQIPLIELTANPPASVSSRQPDKDPVAPSENPALSKPADFSSLEKAVVDLVNSYRASQNLSILTPNERIAEVARAHSQDMAAGRVSLGHDGFEERYQVLSGALSISGLAENVAYNFGYSDPAENAVAGWLKSSGHYKNIIGSYRLTGVGAAKSPGGEYYFTQLFAR